MEKLGYTIANKSGSIRNFVKDTHTLPIQAHEPHNNKKDPINRIDFKKTYEKLGLSKKKFLDLFNKL
jgi:hypothetical protein